MHGIAYSGSIVALQCLTGLHLIYSLQLLLKLAPPSSQIVFGFFVVVSTLNNLSVKSGCGLQTGFCSALYCNASPQNYVHFSFARLSFTFLFIANRQAVSEV